MKSNTIATITLIVVASIIATTFAVTTPAFAKGDTNTQSQGAAQNGLLNAAVGVQANVQNTLNHNNVCVSAISGSTNCP